MKIALVTTTIFVPHVLRLYRRCDPDVRFFIACDLKSPEADIRRLCDQLDPVSPLTVVDQKSLMWKCSELIGWNTIQRRNIATLEALKWGADLIVSVDDDNLPISMDYFSSYIWRLDVPDQAYPNESTAPHRTFSGLLASPEVPWFDVGQLYIPLASQRGFPHQHISTPRFSYVVDARIGVHAGLVIGDPDISAITRIARAPTVWGMHEALRHGVAVNPRHTRTIFNSQNTCYIRELAPAMLLCPQFKRFDDIVASLVAQRVMCETGHHVLHAPPVCLQERNVHNLQRDLDDEAWGQANIHRVQERLWEVSITAGSVVQKTQMLYWVLDEMMPGVGALADAWVEDCQRAMA